MKHHQKAQPSTQPKRRWWQWLALGLMLLAIGMYVISLDDSVVPEVRNPVVGAPAGPGK